MENKNFEFKPGKPKISNFEIHEKVNFEHKTHENQHFEHRKIFNGVKPAFSKHF